MKVIRTGGLLALALMQAIGSAQAAGGYQGLLQPGDMKSLQGFYRLYVADEVRLMTDIRSELRMLKRQSKALRAMTRARGGADDCGKPDCEALARVDAQLARANAAMNEVRRVLKGNLRILLRNQGVATKGDANFMDALAAHERRKFGFDMSMIVAKTFQMDPGPLLAQLGKDLGLSGGVADAGGDVASATGDAARLYLMKGSKLTGDLKRSAFTALAKSVANKLFGQSDASAQLVSSFVQNMTSGLWEAWNQAVALAEKSDVENAKPALTPGMISMVVLQSTLGAMADARGRQLANAVNEARKDAARSESARLLAIAEYKAMAGLDREVYQHGKGGGASSGLAFDLIWERGRFRTALNEACGRRLEMPRPDTVRPGNQKEVAPAQVDLRRTLMALRRANGTLRAEIARLRKDECRRSKENNGVVSSDAAGGLCGGDWRRVDVPGTASVYFARARYASVSHGDTGAGQAPVSIAIPSGARAVEMRISGRVGHPEGGDHVVDVRKAYLRFGVSNISAPINSLIGVFDVGKVWQPVALHHYRDGVKSVSIRVPKGATRLYLGVQDAYGWSNNTGSYAVRYRFLMTSGADLSGKWQFGRSMEHGRPVDKRLCTLKLTDRRVPGKGYVIRGCDPNESYWELACDGTLLFRHRDGSVTSRFTRKGEGLWEGPYLPRPDHPDLGKVRHYLRRAGTGR